ncbi:acyl-phosphate glycerol 3-phosphate acyltransferase [Thioclava sp. SK-1]|uniref:lysophospholipid acyltransferase family protein n=1 Tax=Thioclava sp. SK-1 TaxID=1889770 RepID=UPI00082453DD|nr:lysophospholipid acyltransferase family protein [Thioclava sp. SK-1]OCX63052.1 acyl-phosphate glycerol 3-phosphate acyltransferase [Thioclava sp. SK-1]
MTAPGWEGGSLPPLGRLGPVQWARVIWRGVRLGGVVYLGLLVHLSLRLIERPLYGAARPWTQRLTRMVCRRALAILRIRLDVQGQPMPHKGAVVANHASWLDIFALNACQEIYFVSKAEVAAWPGIGWLARATGTVFIRRDRREAQAQAKLFEQRIGLGHHLLFFPEGTSTDSLRVLPFKPTLFQAFFAPQLQPRMWVQPVSVAYRAPVGQDPRFYGWWGDMGFGPHLLRVLAQRCQGHIAITFHAPLKVAHFADRKALARAAQAAVSGGLQLPD